MITVNENLEGNVKSLGFEQDGATLKDMEYIRMETPFVVTLPIFLGGTASHQ